MPASDHTMKYAARFGWVAWLLCGVLALLGPARGQDLKIGYADEELRPFAMHNGEPDASKRIGSIAYHLYKLDKSRIDYDGKTIKNVGGPIGVNLGYSIADDIRKMGLTVEEVKSTEANLKKLQLGRIAAFAGQDVDTDVWLEHKDYAGIVKLPTPLASKDYFLLFSKQYLAAHPDIAHKFWTRLGEIRDETVKKLAPKYR